jgi:hypothetical protein
MRKILPMARNRQSAFAFHQVFAVLIELVTSPIRPELLTTLLHIGGRGSVDPIDGYAETTKGVRIYTELAVLFWAGEAFRTAFYRMRCEEGRER